MGEDSKALNEGPAVSRTNKATARWEILRQHVEDGVPLTVLAAENHLGLRSLQRWHGAFKLHGKDGLELTAPRKRGRRSPPELIALIEGLSLAKPRRTTAAIHKQANSVALQRGWPPVSYSTVRSIVAGMDPGMLTMAHQGPVAYRDKFELVWRRRAECPNAVWQADHTELDILVLDADQHTVRPWLTTVLDDYSRAICGYMLFTGAPSS